MAGNSSTFTFIGDAGDLVSASNKADDALDSVGTSATSASDDMKKAGQGSDNLTSKLGSLGAGVSGATDAIDSLAGASQALVDIQNYSYERAAKLARAQADVEQAMLDGKQAAVDLENATNDLNQAQADGRQASIDLKQSQIDITQANLDAKAAFDEYNDAVKKHGKNSDEAKQAMIDLRQANLDETQAIEDGNQAKLDANQAITDGKQYMLDGTQAIRDGKDAQLNLNDAMREANPSGLQQWNDKLQMLTPILSGVVGIMGLVTAAQWAWNAAQYASPTTWIVVAIAALVAIFVVLWIKCEGFRNFWIGLWNILKRAALAVADWFTGTIVPSFKRAWDQIKSAASAVGNFFSKTLPGFFRSSWERIKGVWSAVTGWFSRLGTGIRRVFSNIGSSITAPFRAAFNAIARAWNNTVGRLSFTIPGWVPGIGGNSFSAPRLPTYHNGGRVPGAAGQEVMALLRAGERVSTESSQVNDSGQWYPIPPGNAVIDALIDVLATRVAQKGGRAVQLGVRVA